MFIVISVVMFAALFTGGCASAPSPTHGYALNIRVSEPKLNQFYYFDLSRTGEVRYIAGFQAASAEPGSARPTWTGAFTEADLAATVALLEANPTPQQVLPEADKPNYRVAIAPPGSGMFSRITLVTGPTPFITELERGLSTLMWSRRQKELAPLLK